MRAVSFAASMRPRAHGPGRLRRKSLASLHSPARHAMPPLLLLAYKRRKGKMQKASVRTMLPGKECPAARPGGFLLPAATHFSMFFQTVPLLRACSCRVMYGYPAPHTLPPAHTPRQHAPGLARPADRPCAGSPSNPKDTYDDELCRPGPFSGPSSGN